MPGTDVRLSQAAVPARQASKALLAIPYALEDQLADDVETVHFALGARLAGDEWPVAAVSKARLEAWLEPFRTRGARIDLLLPESLCLPLPGDGRWSVLMETELATVRSAAFGGFVCRPADLLTYLDLADPERALGLQIITPRDVATDFSALGRSVDVVPEFGAALDALIRHHQAANAINLLQGDYAPASDMRRAWLPWRRAAVLAAACLLVLAIGGIVDLLRIGAAADAQVEANLQRFRQLFPGQTRVEAINLDSMIAAELRNTSGRAASSSRSLTLSAPNGEIRKCPWPLTSPSLRSDTETLASSSHSGCRRHSSGPASGRPPALTVATRPWLSVPSRPWSSTAMPSGLNHCHRFAAGAAPTRVTRKATRPSTISQRSFIARVPWSCLLYTSPSPRD